MNDYNNSINYFLTALASIWVFILILHILVCVAVASYAQKKGRSFGLFFWLAAALGWALPTLGLALLPSIDARSEFKVKKTKTCPECDELVSSAAKVCKYCGSHFAPADPSSKASSPATTTAVASTLEQPKDNLYFEPSATPAPKPAALFLGSAMSFLVSLFALAYSFSYGWTDDSLNYHPNELHLANGGLFVLALATLIAAIVFLNRGLRIRKAKTA